jgi:hypothetical protein
MGFIARLGHRRAGENLTRRFVLYIDASMARNAACVRAASPFLAERERRSFAERVSAEKSGFPVFAGSSIERRF